MPGHRAFRRTEEVSGGDRRLELDSCLSPVRECWVNYREKGSGQREWYIER